MDISPIDLWHLGIAILFAWIGILDVKKLHSLKQTAGTTKLVVWFVDVSPWIKGGIFRFHVCFQGCITVSVGLWLESSTNQPTVPNI